MRKSVRAILLVVLALLSTVVLGVAAAFTSALSLAASTATVLIMGGTGTPDPDAEPGYVPNVLNYYVLTNTPCTDPTVDCVPLAVVTPETAWPLYGGLSALTWKDSINQGVEDLDAEVQPRLATLSADNRLVIFGYSQSGAIVSIEKQRLAEQLTPEEQEFVKWDIIGNVSRPNGGLNGRLPLTLPIVEFPYGPVTPTNTSMQTDDIALEWDIIADAPLVVTNPLAMFNALIGGPGLGINHGTYPNPEGNPPSGLVGGWTQEQWQAIMDNPEGYAATNPDIVNVQQYNDTRYITVAPRVLPMLVPLHMIGLGFVADLFEPALRDIIEQTGYDRSIPYGQPTTFRLIPIFNPIKLAIDLVQDIPKGIQQALNGGPPPLNPPETLTTSTLARTQETTEPAVEPGNKRSAPKLTSVKDTTPAVEQTTAVTEAKPEAVTDEKQADEKKTDENTVDKKVDTKKTDHKKAGDKKKVEPKKADATKVDTPKVDNEKKADADNNETEKADAAA
ncbi:PE-PPE domain-containing protein [Mycobacterium sp. 3519A]|uniref:PE-PPE domain-containing protein n=1 Tax=Mycobacterium sp. 3519A TaxID=2057184 RepID=UPI000C7C7E3B|nr:PE-PPE domain-containing protein [Mycobacterium sp. 3519A]